MSLVILFPPIGIELKNSSLLLKNNKALLLLKPMSRNI